MWVAVRFFQIHSFKAQDAEMDITTQNYFLTPVIYLSWRLYLEERTYSNINGTDLIRGSSISRIRYEDDEFKL